MNSIKTLLYMGAMHGLFTFYIPYRIAMLDAGAWQMGIFSGAAFFFWGVGVYIIARCSWDMVRRGRGTPAHFDPPKHLIASGLYRHIRNPIYLGALSIVFGDVLWFGSRFAALYLFAYFLAFHILIILIEEPVLRTMFGAEYEEYCRRAGRWLPGIN